MTAFERALAFTLRQEGGYSNNSNDPGGETNFGISKRAYPDLDIKNLTRVTAAEIYHVDYWMKATCDRMPAAVAIAHFDCAVHSGIARAGVLLQELVGAKADGDVGDATMDALRLFLGGRGEEMAAHQLVRARMRFLVQLERGKNRWMFLEGFMARCLDLAVLVSK